MRATLTGHAGLFIESGGTSVLCDPWFTPAYFASWFPFPDNAGLNLGQFASPTYLYISHLHRDHFDPRFLAEHVSKDTVVLLPEYPLDELRQALEDVGFSRFVQTADGEPTELDGIRVAICTATTPADGPLGDSTIAVDDGEVRLLNQNDCRPPDLDLIRGMGPYDVHLLQYSGAIWYPMAYRFDPETKHRLGREKRANQMARAFRYVKEVGATHVVPFAGPPAFLDDDLFALNDFDRDPANIFVDQPVFVEYLAERGVANAHLAITGSVLEVAPGSCSVTHPISAAQLDTIFTDKKAYLQAYQQRRRPQIEAMWASCPQPPSDDALVSALADRIDPLLAGARRVCRNLGGPIVVDFDTAGVVIDPARRQVRRWEGEEWDHYFAIDRRLIGSLVERQVDDWVNDLFLSCRFEAQRAGGYNGTVFSFFKCLSPERMAYLEQSLAPTHQATTHRLTDEERAAEGEMWRCGEYLVQRRCPHLGGDLARFGEREGQVLTCTLHGWRFDLETGRCLTADHTGLRVEPGPPED